MSSEGRAPVLKKSRWFCSNGNRTRRGAALPPARSAPLQPQDRPSLPSRKSFSSLDYNSPAWAASSRRVCRRHALPHRAHEKMPVAAPARNSSSTTSVPETAFSGVVEGLNNKAKSHEKILWFRTFHVLELALYHSLGSYLSPNQPTISLTSQIANKA